MKGLTALYEACKDVEETRGFFNEPTIRAVMKGQEHDYEWWTKLHLHLLVSVWTAFLHSYEGVSEVVNTNIIKVILDLLEAAKTKTVYELEEQFRKFLDPLAAHFALVDEFKNFLLASLRATVIQLNTMGDTPMALAWAKAYELLVYNLHSGQMLNNALVDKAVSLGEMFMTEASREVKVQHQQVTE